MKAPKRLIGRSDQADFPEFGLTAIDIKVDTGAYTSALHCHHIVESTPTDTGQPRLSFRLLDPSHPQYDDTVFYTAKFSRKLVKSSNGETEERYVIATFIVLFGKRFPIALTLSERGEMRFPVLIGRKFLKGRFIVDPALTDLSATASKTLT